MTLQAHLKERERGLDAREQSLREREAQLTTEAEQLKAEVTELVGTERKRYADLEEELSRALSLKLAAEKERDNLRKGSENQTLLPSPFPSPGGNSTPKPDSTLADLRKEIQNLKRTRLSEETNKDQNGCSSNIPASVIIKEALANVPSFDGSNLNAFLRSCKRARAVVPTNMEVDLVKLMKNKLRDRAYVAIELDNFDSFDEFADRLKQIFAPHASANSYRGKLAALVKRTNESILDYISKILEIRDALVDATKAENFEAELTKRESERIDREIIEGFRDGLPYWFRSRLTRDKNLPLQDVFNDAISVEREIERDRLKHHSEQKGTNRSSTNNNAEVTTKRDSEVKTESTNEARPTVARHDSGNGPSEDRPKYDPTLTCRYCKKVGHSIEDCYSLKRRNEQRAKELNNSGNAEAAPGTSDAPRDPTTMRPVNAVLTGMENTPFTTLL